MKRNKPKLLAFSLLLTILLLGCSNTKYVFNDTNDKMLVHFIDVGQGDATLIQVNNKNLLIDSGPKDNRNKIISYLESLNIETIDYIIATHPHDDHIGNMSYIIDNFDIVYFYAPKIESNTKTFENMVYSLKNNNLKINIIKEGLKSINLGSNTNLSVFSPINDIYDNLNNYSPIIKIQYGKTSFLFTGDAECDIEKEILNKGYNINSNIIKIGHHGSLTSTSLDFINKVNPILAIISVGKDNEYGLPSKEILNRLDSLNINYYRTDINGNILLISDGDKLYTKIACNENIISLHAILHHTYLLFLFLLY